MKYLDGLNEAQKQAVLATSGPVSVLAGAGSGKTRVLTTRIYHLIREGIPGEKILAVTFTNKAAREMRERVRTLLGEEVDSAARVLNDPGLPFVATFHGLGRELLESYGSSMGLPRFFSIFDRDDSEKVIAEALKQRDISVKELSPRAVLGRISRAKGEGMTAETYKEKFGRGTFGARVTAELWQHYDEKLRKEKALDFDDLIALPVRMLEKHEEVRRAVQARWDYVHIDEYQDTNALQGKLAKLLVAKHNNLFVVGDGDQAIYGWRGAKMEYILNFEKEYEGAETIMLEHNYRSTKNLVEAANGVIKENKKRKERVSVTDNPSGEPIRVYAGFSAEDEARFIATRAQKLIQEGELPETIAILFRTNFQSRALEEGLLRVGVPYKLLGTKFFERKEVKDMLAWVRLALEPSRETDKIRAAQFPPRGVGKTTLAKLAAGKRDELGPAARSKVEAFEKVIAELSDASDTLVPSEFLKLVAEKTGMRRVLVDEGSEEDRERFENIQELATLAARHDSLPGKEGIAAFLADAALAGDQDELDRDGKKGVNLMTVHAAKGLEFDTVFVAGMEEGLFPHQGMGDRERDEEEERRLFYVAMTRARKRLILTLARVRKIYGTDFLQEPSSFLQDIDNSLIEYEEGENERTVYIT